MSRYEKAPDWQCADEGPKRDDYTPCCTLDRGHAGRHTDGLLRDDAILGHRPRDESAD